MLITRMPMESLFRRPFATLSDNGYAGLVFAIMRSADAPSLSRSFVRDWTDIHDVTGSALAVVTPGDGIVFPAVGWGREAVEIEGLSHLGDNRRLRRVMSGDHRSSVRIGLRDTPDATVAPFRPDGSRRHRDAISGSATTLQNIFGLPESLLPCAVVVCLYDRAAVAVQLGDLDSLYSFLRSLKIEIETTLVRIGELQEELYHAKLARTSVRERYRIGDLERKQAGSDRDWERQRRDLANDLDGAATGLDGARGGDLRWLADRLRDGSRLDAEARDAVREIATALTGSGRLPRRIRRTVARMNSEDGPQDPEFAARLRLARNEEAAAQDRIGAVKQSIDELGRTLRLHDAVIEVGRSSGMLPADSSGHLADNRRFDWPVTVLGRRPAHGHRGSLTYQRRN